MLFSYVLIFENTQLMIQMRLEINTKSLQILVFNYEYSFPFFM